MGVTGTITPETEKGTIGVLTDLPRVWKSHRSGNTNWTTGLEFLSCSLHRVLTRRASCSIQQQQQRNFCCLPSKINPIPVAFVLIVSIAFHHEIRDMQEHKEIFGLRWQRRERGVMDFLHYLGSPTSGNFEIGWIHHMQAAKGSN
jgi:hypothetical protein